MPQIVINYVVLFVLVGITVWADYLLKISAQETTIFSAITRWEFLVGMIAYALGAFGWLLSIDIFLMKMDYC